MMNDQIRYYRFVSKFVDAVATEPLVRALRNPPMPFRLRRATATPTPRPQPVETPLPRAA